MFSDGATLFVPLKVKEKSLGSLNDCAELVGLNGRMKNLSAKPYLLITSGGLGSVNCVSQWLQSWTKVFCLRKSHWNWEERDANSSLILLIKDNWEKLHNPKTQGSPPETPRERTWHVFSVILNSVSTTKPEITVKPETEFSGSKGVFASVLTVKASRERMFLRHSLCKISVFSRGEPCCLVSVSAGWPHQLSPHLTRKPLK